MDCSASRHLRDDPQASLLDRLSDVEVLDLLGPSWSAMSVKSRQAYGQLDSSPPVGRSRYPALKFWRASLSKGNRTPTMLDVLWRAACAEANALDAEAAGLTNAAASFRREARAILRSARRAA